MTASAQVKASKKKSMNQVEDIKRICSIQYSPLTLVSVSPILHNHIFVKLKKPATKHGFYGHNFFSMEEENTGVVHVLWRIYLKKFVSEIKNGRTPKRAIIFVKKLEHLTEMDEFLTIELGHLDFVNDPETSP